MLKSELIKQAENLRAELWEKSRECRELKGKYDAEKGNATLRLNRMKSILTVIEAVIVMKYPSESFYPPSLMMPGDVVDTPDAETPEELCLLRHLYSLAQ